MIMRMPKKVVAALTAVIALLCPAGATATPLAN
jgi:hypothetical protein